MTVTPVRTLAICGLSLALLTGCQGGSAPWGGSPVTTALRSLGGVAEADLTVVVVDAEALTKALGVPRDAVIDDLTGDERLWLHEARNLGALSAPGARVLPSTMGYSWSAAGLSRDVRAFSIYGGASDAVVEEARASLEEAGYSSDGGSYTPPAGSSPFAPTLVAIDGGTIASVDQEKGGVLLGDDSPAIDHPEISSITGCLDGAHLVGISTLIPVGIGIRVEEGAAEAWACIHREGATLEDAESLTPTSQGVSITSVSVDDSVMRVQLGLENPDAGPAEAVSLVSGLQERTFPGF